MRYNNVFVAKLNKYKILKSIVFLLAVTIGSKQLYGAPASNTTLLVKANNAFTDKEYDKAIKLYRKIIRKNKKDYNAWNNLAASYFHSGLPRRALRYFKYTENKTNLKSFNYFYQGLCYDALEMRSKARIYFKKAAHYLDSYGARSMFELGVTDYQRKKKEKAAHWLNLYVQRFPRGKYYQDALYILQSIRQGRHLKEVKGIERPNMNDALYKYNKLSLYPIPHYWATQIGFESNDIELQEKNDDGTFHKRQDSQQFILANAGIGVGPIQKAKGTVWAGYTYRQFWGTNTDRINTYFDDPGDFEYQPFRPDLLERHHQLYTDARIELPWKLFAGAYGRLEYARIGSRLYTGPEIQSIDPSVLEISNTSLLIPWIGYAWTPNMRTIAYAYFRKEVNLESPEFSVQSYTFQADSSEQVPISLGLKHHASIPKYNLDIEAEAYSYNFIANDPWLDFNKLGGSLSIEHQIMPRLYINAKGGYYQDSYALEILRIGTCDKKVDITTGDQDNANSENRQFQSCKRTDGGYSIKLGAHWNYSQFHRIEGNFTIIDNSNPNQPEFDSHQTTYMLIATMAFPSVTRVDRIINRFADNTFTKAIQ
ncbi:MAG: hypothetical protein R3B45_12650 [Bdellovibrionota bacterium]